jgi:hypothetical protein
MDLRCDWLRHWTHTPTFTGSFWLLNFRRSFNSALRPSERLELISALLKLEHAGRTSWAMPTIRSHS